MKTYGVFLRGINVGGHKKFPKVEQLELATSLNFHHPQVYLHTGNWIIRSDQTKEKIEASISKAITQRYGWEIPLIIKAISEIEQLLGECPFGQEKKENSYFILLKEIPSEENVKLVNSLEYPNEEFHITDPCIYLFCALGYGRVKLSNNFFEKKLKITATTRNYKTLTKLLEISQNIP